MKMINFNYSLNIIFIIGFVLKFIKNEKEINLNNEQMYSINYIDKNIQNSETNIYKFILKRNAKIKFGLESSSDYSEEISVYLYEKNIYTNTKKIIEFHNLKINHFIFIELNGSQDQINYYIEYNYLKLHNVLFTVSFIESNNKEEIYTIEPSKDNNNINNYYYFDDFTIYFRIILNSFTAGMKVPIIVTGDFEEEIYFTENNDYQEMPDEIIKNFYYYPKKIRDIRHIDKNMKKLILYYEKTNDYYILNLKIRLNSAKRGINSITVSFAFKEEVSDNFIKEYKKNSGLFGIFHLNYLSLSSNTSLIVYTNITSILTIYEITSEEESKFIFGKQDNKVISKYKCDDNKKVSIININQEFVYKNILIFQVVNAYEDFIFQFFLIENNNIQYQQFLKRNEKINFIREIEHSELINEQMHIIINEYQNNDEPYIYYNDMIYGDFECRTFNLGTEIIYNNIKDNYDFLNPCLMDSGAEISYLKLKTNPGSGFWPSPDGDQLYGYNEYKIKCDNYNNKYLNKGDFIYICLKGDEKTKINMPVGQRIKFKISLLFYYKSDYKFSVRINSDNNIFDYILNRINYEMNLEWNNDFHGNKINIKNDNQIPILLSLKIYAEDIYIEKIKSSQKKIKVEKNKLYALLLPNYSSKGEIYGVYQELISLNQINNICIYYEMNINEKFSFPPKASCNNVIKDSKELNITNYGIYVNNQFFFNTEYFYTCIFYNGEEDIYLNYKHMVISNNELEHKKINKLEETNDILFYKINDMYSEYNLLFLQLIKNNKSELSPIYIQNKEKLKMQNYRFTILLIVLMHLIIMVFYLIFQIIIN